MSATATTKLIMSTIQPNESTMSATQQTGNAKNGPLINKLPTEILIIILKNSVSESTNHALLAGGLHRSGLDFRLVCWNFRDHSLEAYADYIGSTIFDLRSPASIKNLIAISDIQEIAQHVKTLKFTCFSIHRKCFGDWEDARVDAGQLNPAGIYEEYIKIRREEASWFPNAFDRSVHGTLLPVQPHIAQLQMAEVNTLAQILAKCLIKFPKLQDVSFLDEQDPLLVPKQWERVYQSLKRHKFWCCGSYVFFKSATAISGLDILLRALASGKIFPTTLFIPVLHRSYYSFASITPPEVLKNACLAVKNLRLGEHSDRRNLGQGKHEFLMTFENFPALRHLWWGGVTEYNSNEDGGRFLSTTTPSPSDLPVLTRITFSEIGIINDALRGFLSSFSAAPKPTLTHVEFISCWQGPWNKLFSVLGTLDLDRLEIKPEKEGWYDMQALYGIDWKMDRDLLKNAARVVHVGPDELKNVIEGRAPPAFNGRSRLLWDV